MQTLEEQELLEVSGGWFWVGPVSGALIRYAIKEFAKEAASAAVKAGTAAGAGYAAGELAAGLSE